MEAFSSIQHGKVWSRVMADGPVGFLAEERGEVKQFEQYDSPETGFTYLREVARG
jgi:hypothetical protein